MITAYDEACKARAILQPSTVELHTVPNWMRVALYRKLGIPAYSCGLIMNAVRDAFYRRHWHDGGFDFSWRWLDHWGRTVLSGKKCLVAEPYLNESDLEEVRAFAEFVGCDWSLSANSEWYPGCTIRIIFWEPDKAI